jgi:rare lipoprotein A
VTARPISITRLDLAAPKTTLALKATSVLAATIALTATLILAGCASAPPKSDGGYYLDDGPGASPPADIEAIPDAVPRAEPINRATTRPYTVLGRSYRPYTRHQAYRVRGLASWYGKRYHGKQTANGETYDMYAMTAAHTVLPLPSYARVTNLSNGRSVVVRVNDRGPFHDDRVLDVSYAAAYKLGFVDEGSAMVEIEVIIPGETSTAGAPVVAMTEPPPRAGPLTSGESGIFLQLGAFSDRDNAQVFVRRVRSDMVWLGDSIHLYKSGNLYKVHAGPYDNRVAADRDAVRVYQDLGLSPIVLSR